MNENDTSKKTHGVEKEAHSAEHHAPWQLEKDTEGLDNPTLAETPYSKEAEEKSSEGCGCKYF